MNVLTPAGAITRKMAGAILGEHPAPTPHPAGRPIAYSHHQSSVKRVEALGFLAGLHLMVLLLEERISCSSALLNRRLPTHPPPPLISPFTLIDDNLVPSSSPTPTSSPFHVVVVAVVAAASYASSVTILAWTSVPVAREILQFVQK